MSNTNIKTYSKPTHTLTGVFQNTDKLLPQDVVCLIGVREGTAQTSELGLGQIWLPHGREPL